MLDFFVAQQRAILVSKFAYAVVAEHWEWVKDTEIRV